jgi:hypothetical protein
MPKSWLTLKCFQKRKKKKTFFVITHKREQGRNLLKKDLRKKCANIKLRKPKKKIAKIIEKKLKIFFPDLCFVVFSKSKSSKDYIKDKCVFK